MKTATPPPSPPCGLKGWLDTWVGGFFRALDDYKITRRVVLLVTLYVTVDSYKWAKTFVDQHADRSGLELGLAVGAVLAAVTALQTIVLKLYVNSGGEAGASESA
jgi:hypothetical protein